ncbi:hypothetical protein [Bradyrhizobium ottawaense]|uniref:hypothetical protein n=1 Tax=Bradyrhizobium ottawaense TaxID=931866 RepID=UPI0030F37824
MAKMRVKPIEYGQTANDALAACKNYLQEAEQYIQGDRKSLPDPTPLLTARFPSSSLLEAKAKDGVDGLAWPTIAAKIVDRMAKSDRFFDPWYFAVLLLLELPGGRIVLNRSNHQQYFYAAYAGSNAKENFYLRRIVVNTPIWADTQEGRHRDGAHYDYRRATLHWVCKDVVRTLGKKTRTVSSNREGAIRFAVKLFKQQLAAHGLSPRSRLPGLELTAQDYERLLSIALYIADAMHEKHLVAKSRNG